MKRKKVQEIKALLTPKKKKRLYYLFCADQVRFVEEHHICKCDLLHCLIEIVRP
jgi:hypothetical protein